MNDRHMQIGEAAERVGLSIRTIRHEEAGLVGWVPALHRARPRPAPHEGRLVIS
jgi:hypothetical protein